MKKLGEMIVYGKMDKCLIILNLLFINLKFYYREDILVWISLKEGKLNFMNKVLNYFIVIVLGFMGSKLWDWKIGEIVWIDLKFILWNFF